MSTRSSGSAGCILIGLAASAVGAVTVGFLAGFAYLVIAMIALNALLPTSAVLWAFVGITIVVSAVMLAVIARQTSGLARSLVFVGAAGFLAVPVAITIWYG